MLLRIDLEKPPGRRRAVLTHIVGGYINRAIVIVQGLLMVPFYLHFVGSHMYGLWLASGGVLAWLGFVDMRLGAVLNQRIGSAYGLKNYRKAADYFFNGLLCYLLICLLFSLAAYGMSYTISPLFRTTHEETQVLRMCFLLAAFSMVVNIINDGMRSFAQALQRPLVPAMILAISRILGLIFILYLLFNDFKLYSIALGFVLASLIALFVNSVYSIILFYSLGGQPVCNRQILLDYFSLSPSLVAGKLGHSIVNKTEPVIISAIIFPEAATAFVITKRVAEMVRMLIRVVFSAFLPSFVNIYVQDHKKSGYVLSETINICLISGFIGFCIYVAVNQSFVSLWVGTNNFTGQNVTIMIALGTLMVTILGCLFQLLVCSGDIIKPSYMLLLESLLRVVMMVSFLKLFGLIGIPCAWVISCGIFSLFLYKRLSRKIILYGKRYIGILGMFAVMFSCCSYLGYKINVFNSWLYLILISISVLCVLTSVYILTNPTSYSFIRKGTISNNNIH